jgi:hypothetical protein
MPTLPHEAPLLLFRERPDLVPTLLRDVLGIAIPAHARVRVEESNFAQIVPAEYRADLVLTLASDGGPVMGIVVEVQLTRDPRKRFTWPLYVAALHAKLACATCLVVVTADDDVARWAAEPITTLQPGPAFTPLVFGPERIPIVTDAAEATRQPELAVLSALAHGREGRAVEIGRAALTAVARLDDERRALYTDLVLYALAGAAREALEIEMNLTNYEFKSDFFKLKLAEGEARGEARGKARAVLAVLAARGLAVSDEIRSRVLACTDLSTLDRWIARAATASTADDVVRDT